MEADSAAEFAVFYQASRDRCLRAVLASVGYRQLAEDLTRRSTNPCDHLAAVVIRQLMRDTCPPADARQVYRPADHMTGGSR
jgi:hypothetical protein